MRIIWIFLFYFFFKDIKKKVLMSGIQKKAGALKIFPKLDKEKQFFCFFFFNFFKSERVKSPYN